MDVETLLVSDLDALIVMHVYHTTCNKRLHAPLLVPYHSTVCI